MKQSSEVQLMYRIQESREKWGILISNGLSRLVSLGFHTFPKTNSLHLKMYMEDECSFWVPAYVQGLCKLTLDSGSGVASFPANLRGWYQPKQINWVLNQK